MIKFALGISLLLMSCSTFSQKIVGTSTPVKVGAERTSVYFPFLKNKRVAVFANQTSMVGNEHLIDKLLSAKMDIKKIFGPEHGFRGNADAGEHVKDGVDAKTGIQIISLYGSHKKPTKEDFADVDIVLFDIQDVGVRFYTYISSLQYVVESCLENDVPLLILDRPNPNGFYVDGPVLDRKFSSFVGMQPVPIVYGMTIGEYALMLMGENWLSTAANKKFNASKQTMNAPGKDFNVKIISCEGYDHLTKYTLPVSPSPNLREMQSIYWYPSTCFFEGTVISEGRGTDKPFQYFGHPALPKNLFSFTPVPNEGAKDSKCFGQKCYGYDLSAPVQETLLAVNGKIQLQYLLDVYKLYPDKSKFFLANNFIDKLAGTDLLRKQVLQGMNEKEIKKTWQPALNDFKKIRKKYLLYKDFE